MSEGKCVACADGVPCAYHPRVPDSPFTALQDAPGGNERGLVANEDRPLSLRELLTEVDAIIGSEEDYPWHEIPDRLRAKLAALAPLPPMHCRDEDGRTFKVQRGLPSGFEGENGTVTVPLYRLTEVEPT